MSWPLSQDYNEAIQNPRTSFGDAELRNADPAVNALGIPIPRSGNFADVYEFRSTNGGHWAVKCFTREVPGLRERYAAISRHLQEARLPFTVDFTFLEQGLRVRGQWYPVLKMHWVEGFTLNEFVRQHADKPAMLEALLQIWLRMASRLRGVGIAHADLQHGNVLLVPVSSSNALAAKLVDYDGMFVPALAGSKSGEVGHPCYQHPQRLAEGTYSAEVDRFPLLLVATALHAVKVGGRALWEKYDSGDNLLFREVDLRAPVKSPLFYELLKLADERTSRLARQTLDALKGRLELVPLLEEVLPELHHVPPAKPVTALATPKRTTALAAATPPASEAVAVPSALNFESEEKPRSRRRRRKSGLSRGVLGAAVAMLVLVGGILALVFRQGDEKPKTDVRIAQKKAEKTQQRPEKAKEKVDVKEEEPDVNPPRQKDADPPVPVQPRPEEPKGEEDAPAEKPRDGFVSLFNGKDLTGWKPHPADEARWEVKNGNLIGSGEKGYLFSERGDYENFHYRVEAMINSRGTSGQYFRSEFDPGFPKGYVAQIDANSIDPHKTGSLYGIIKVTEQLHKPDEWFTQEVIAEGDHITIKVNGKIVVDTRDSRHKKGHFALQQYGPASVIAFRKIEVKELPEKTTSPEPSKAVVKDDFVSLFNGKDLTGWKPHPADKAKWEVKDGILIGSGERGHLFSESGDYENFHSRIEAMINDGGNSGQYFRSAFGPGFPKGYLAQIGASAVNPQKTGSLIGIAKVTERLHKPDEWFTQEVIAEGDHITIKVNGKIVVNTRDSRYKKGHFALQQHDATTRVQFRKIEVKFLKIEVKVAEPAVPSRRVESDLPPEAKAVKAYEKSCADARKKLLAGFDTAVNLLSKSKGSAEERLKRIDTIKEEKERFDKNDSIPWSEPMRPFVAKYLYSIKVAEIKVRRVYDSRIDAQLRAKNDSKVASLRADLHNFGDFKVVAKWRYFVNGGGGNVVSLYSNGRVYGINNPSTWSYDKGILTMQFPNPRAPGGAWIDTLRVSADGTTMSGTNQLGKVKLSGVYVKDN